MELTFTGTERDYYEALIAHQRRTPFKKWTLQLLKCLVFVFGVAAVFGLFFAPASVDLVVLAPLLVVAILWAIILWAVPYRAARALFRKQPAAQGSHTVMLDDSGVHWRWDGGSSDLQWKNFIGFLDSERQFLLYVSPRSFQTVPKRDLAPLQVSEFRSILEQHLGSSRKSAVPSQGSV